LLLWRIPYTYSLFSEKEGKGEEGQDVGQRGKRGEEESMEL